MALTPADINLQKMLLATYQAQAQKAADDISEATERLGRANQAVQSTLALLRAEGVDVAPAQKGCRG